MRFLVRRRMHIEQTFGGQQQAQDLGAKIFLSSTVSGPADSGGYPASFTVDSIIPDSGTPQPVADNISKVRGLVFLGRLTPQGEFRSTTASDSAVAQNVSQLLGSFRDFFPRIPAEGVRPGATWTDTLSLTQRGAGSEVMRRSVLHSTAAGWESYAGARSLRIETSATYSLTGAGQNNGQPFEVGGSGIASSHTFLAEDGRFLGGESSDSTTLTVSLPMQRLTIPVTQTQQSTVTSLP